MRILVVGCRGMLGRDLMENLPGDDDLTGVDIEECDITDPVQCRELVKTVVPDWIVNAAAYTAVDACETHREIAMAVNGAGPGNLAAAARENGASMLHVSTDYVFDGTKREPYDEMDPVAPQTVYGESKLAGERRVAEILPDHHLIVRTSWLFGEYGKNFVDTILFLAANGKPLRIVSDQYGCPTYSGDLVRMIRGLIDNRSHGIVHATNSGVTTWYDFAVYFVSKLYPGVSIAPVTTEAFPRPARRPEFSVLSTERLDRLLGCSQPVWQDAVDRYLESKYPGPIKE